jgi:hypothetical protein
LRKLSFLIQRIIGENALIMSIHLVSGDLERELPIDFYLLVVAFYDNRKDFFFSTSGNNKDFVTVPRLLLERLTDAVCYAA